MTAEAPVIDTKKQTTAVNVGLDGAAIDSLRARSLGGDAVGPGHRHGPGERRRLRVGAAARLHGQGSDARATPPGISTGSPSPTCRRCPRRSTTTSTCSRKSAWSPAARIPKSATGGVQLNFVLKSGTNGFRGQLKGYLEDPAHLPWMQSNNVTPELAAQFASEDSQGDRTDQMPDWGGDVGGPVLRDRWWFWGAWGQQDIRLRKISGTTDRTLLQNASFKTEAQATAGLRASFSFFQSEKKKWGRNAGPFVAQEASRRSIGRRRPEPHLQRRTERDHRQQCLPRWPLRAHQPGLSAGSGRRRGRPHVRAGGQGGARIELVLRHPPAVRLGRLRRQRVPGTARAEVRFQLAAGGRAQRVERGVRLHERRHRPVPGER